jgi:hypothetical protein
MENSVHGEPGEPKLFISLLLGQQGLSTIPSTYHLQWRVTPEVCTGPCTAIPNPDAYVKGATSPTEVGGYHRGPAVAVKAHFSEGRVQYLTSAVRRGHIIIPSVVGMRNGYIYAGVVQMLVLKTTSSRW